MDYDAEYTRAQDLEVEGHLILSDPRVAGCAVTVPDAAFSGDAAPTAAELRACAELCNALKAALNALIEAIT